MTSDAARHGDVATIGDTTPTGAAWRTSSFSSNGASCVEVLEADGETWLRDTKDGGLGEVLHLTGSQWSAFLTEVANGAPSANGAVEVRPGSADGRDLAELSSGTVLRFTAAEWTAFRSGVLAGEFHPVVA